MTYQEEMYAHLVHGGDPQVLLDAFMKDLNEAQKKADAAKEAEKEKEMLDAEKKAAKANLISAAQKYLALVGYCFSYKEIEDMVNAITESVSLLSDLTITYNGKKFSIFD